VPNGLLRKDLAAGVEATVRTNMMREMRAPAVRAENDRADGQLIMLAPPVLAAVAGFSLRKCSHDVSSLVLVLLV
jgi:hypothetical protein